MGSPWAPNTNSAVFMFIFDDRTYEPEFLSCLPGHQRESPRVLCWPSFRIRSNGKDRVVPRSSLVQVNRLLLASFRGHFTDISRGQLYAVAQIVSPCCRAYPAGDGKPFIRCSMFANKHHLRQLSASNSPQ